MPALLLTGLKLIFIALIYIFVWQIARAIAAHLGAGQTSSRRKPGAALVIARSETQAGTELDIKDALVVGRSSDADFVLDDAYASEYHVRFVNQEGHVVLHDLGSTNGTYVNGRRVTAPLDLNQGDAVQIGKTVLEVK